ncbi:MAG: sel1 repeat family protein, partial [Ruminococcaceae bacterium]|nr:sel1 repeat family protein [Oscillospiraceae bacterium]
MSYNDVNLELLQKAAEEGDAEAQKNLGKRYYYGDGVEQDYVKAFEWTEKAANQGHTIAQYNLGVMYENGDG